MSGAYDSLPFVWTETNFGTHNAHMDEEHRGLFVAMDKLDQERTLASYESLAGLVIQHFKDEEELGLSEGHKVSRVIWSRIIVVKHSFFFRKFTLIYWQSQWPRWKRSRTGRQLIMIL